jgi:hypothetical protein
MKNQKNKNIYNKKIMNLMMLMGLSMAIQTSSYFSSEQAPQKNSDLSQQNPSQPVDLNGLKGPMDSNQKSDQSSPEIGKPENLGTETPLQETQVPVQRQPIPTPTAAATETNGSSDSQSKVGTPQQQNQPPVNETNVGGGPDDALKPQEPEKQTASDAENNGLNPGADSEVRSPIPQTNGDGQAQPQPVGGDKPSDQQDIEDSSKQLTQDQIQEQQKKLEVQEQEALKAAELAKQKGLQPELQKQNLGEQEQDTNSPLLQTQGTPAGIQGLPLLSGNVLEQKNSGNGLNTAQTTLGQNAQGEIIVNGDQPLVNGNQTLVNGNQPPVILSNNQRPENLLSNGKMNKATVSMVMDPNLEEVKQDGLLEKENKTLVPDAKLKPQKKKLDVSKEEKSKEEKPSTLNNLKKTLKRNGKTIAVSAGLLSVAAAGGVLIYKSQPSQQNVENDN